MKRKLEEMEERDRQFVRAVRALTIAKGTTITYIDASTNISGYRFNMLLFCNTGASVDICSMKTVRKREARLECKQMASNIVAVQGGAMHLVGTDCFYL